MQSNLEAGRLQAQKRYNELRLAQRELLSRNFSMADAARGFWKRGDISVSTNSCLFYDKISHIRDNIFHYFEIRSRTLLRGIAGANFDRDLSVSTLFMSRAHLFE